MAKYDVHFLDVWGNEEEGYDVNDVYPRCGQVEIGDDYTDAQILAALVAEDLVKATAQADKLDIDGESGYTLYLSYDGSPEMELRAAKTDYVKPTTLTPFFVKI